jgi:hypothetical protein
MGGLDFDRKPFVQPTEQKKDLNAGGVDFDRKPFVRPTEQLPKPRRSNTIPGSVILLVVVILGGVAAWRYVSAGGPSAPSDPTNAALQQIEKRLDVLEHRMDRLDRRHHQLRSSAAVSGEETHRSFPEHSAPISVLPARVSSLRDSKPVQAASVASSTRQAADPSKGSTSSKRVGSPQVQPSPSSHQEWEATANRLGDIAGELATQQNAIDQTQQSLGKLSARLGQHSTPFTLRKGGNLQRVGPVRLRLEKVDLKRRRYSLRLLIGDDSIELKNEAVLEAVPFYISGRSGTFELIVLRLSKDGVAGRLAFPPGTSGR